MRTHKITILHSNDMHGDFYAEVQAGGGKLTGGLALLAGYINKVRSEEEKVIYCIAGDMVQGSIIDAEYRGVSTIEIMNYLAPDVVTLGNHEFDYGLPHLIFLEKMANFPIVNANLYIRKYNKRLMRPYHIVPMAGLDIMFIGVITDKVIDALHKDGDVGSFITLEDAAAEAGKITNAYKNDDIDLSILLTHIGFESDLELARLLKPEWGVDMIIGGHSHTILEQPAQANGILVTQAGTGTDQIGRFDITVDDDTNAIVDWRWQLVPIVEGLVEPDRGLQEFIDSFKTEVDRKYNTVVTRFASKLTHPQREVETALGNLLADGMAEADNCDVVLLGSGSVRLKEMGPVVTLGNFVSCFPYNDTLTRFTVDGAHLWRMFAHWMRPENRTGEGECYQVNGNVRAVYDERARRLESLLIKGVPVRDDQLYTVVLAGYHVSNCAAYLNITYDELTAAGRPKVVSTAAQDVLLEFLRNNQNLSRKVEGRLLYK
ncbi:MAG: bifunctional metallophosphatase/5'-nucleotidase [Anaerolineae bacterium]